MVLKLILIIILMLIVIALAVKCKAYSKEVSLYSKDLFKTQELLKESQAMIMLLESGKNIKDVLLKYNVKNMAVYGFGELGCRVMEQLLFDDEITLMYGIDSNAHGMSIAIDVYTLEEVENLTKPDVILLTTFDRSGAIKKAIEESTHCKVIELKEILYGK